MLLMTDEPHAYNDEHNVIVLGAVHEALLGRCLSETDLFT